MKKKIDWTLLCICVVVTLAVGFAGNLLGGNTEEIYPQLEKPPLSPPAAVFSVVWTALYLCLGVGIYFIAEKKSEYGKGTLGLYAVTLIANALWPLWFRRLHLYTFAAFWIGAMVVLAAFLLYRARRESRTAMWLFVPYLVWLCFALYLNVGVAVLN
ncbi:MAG: tryptophan-rich sensory protein [Clostridia bacterium]|nr:tryptophan-rich sensory protein [Clostridia bacterium]